MRKPAPKTYAITGKHLLRDLQVFYPETKQVRDAVEELPIHVKATDVVFSDPKRPTGCATARCIMRETGEKMLPVVSSRYTYLINPSTGVATRYANSQPLTEQIRDYDNTGLFRPGDYTLRLPNPAHAIGSQHLKPDVRNTNKHKRLRRVVRGWREVMANARALTEKIEE